MKLYCDRLKGERLGAGRWALGKRHGRAWGRWALGAQGHAQELGAQHAGAQRRGGAGRRRVALRHSSLGLRHGQGLGHDTELGWPRHGHARGA